MISEEYPKGHPQVVQPAIQQAMNLIKNLRNIEKGQPLIPFKYYNKGSMATIGRNNAVVELQKIRFSGFPAWAVWLFIHLMSIVGVKNRLFIFIDWMWSYFTYDPSCDLSSNHSPLKKRQKIKATINKASLSRNPIIIETIFELARLSLKQRVYHGIGKVNSYSGNYSNYTPS